MSGGTVHYLDLIAGHSGQERVEGKFGFKLCNVQNANKFFRDTKLQENNTSFTSSAVAADLHPSGWNSRIRSATSSCCSGLVHFKASDESGWKWIIKLNQQPEFEGNKQANCVASGCVNRLQYGYVFRLVWMWLGVCSQCIHLVFSPSRSQGPSSSQHHHSISWYAGKLKGKCPVKQHDNDAEHPFKDGWCMLQDEALLTEKHTTWGTWLRTTPEKQWFELFVCRHRPNIGPSLTLIFLWLFSNNLWPKIAPLLKG